MPDLLRGLSPEQRVRLEHVLSAPRGPKGRLTRKDAMNSVATIACGWPRCERAFGSEEARRIHRQVTHGEAGDRLSWPCKISTCSSTFGTEENRDAHMRQKKHGSGHHDQRPEPAAAVVYGCHEITCRRSFETEELRDEHYLQAHHRAPTPAPADLEEDEPEDLPSVAQLLIEEEAKASVALDGETQAVEPSEPSAGTVERTSVPPTADEDDTADDLSADAGSSPAPRSEDTDEEEPATASDKGDGMGKAEFLCEDCGKICGSAAGLAAHRRKHRGKASGSSTSSEATKPAPAETVEAETIEPLSLAGTGSVVDLTLEELDVLDAAAYLQRVGASELLRRVVVEALEELGDDARVAQLVRLRPAREVTS